MSDITTAAEQLADSILKAAGSGLRHYTMQKTRDEIIGAAVTGLEAERARAVTDVLGMLTCHELYQYRPSAFNGFVTYARETLCLPEPELPEVTEHFGRNYFNAGWNMAGGDYRQEEAFLQFIGKAA